MLESTSISPRYAAALGVACAFLLIGLLLAVGLLVGVPGLSETVAGTAVSTPSLTEAQRERARELLTKYERAIGSLNERLATLREELARPPGVSGAPQAPGAPDKTDKKTDEKTDVRPTGPATEARLDYRGRTGAPALQRSDPSVVVALQTLGFDAGQEEEWREAVEVVHREVRAEEYRDLRNIRVDKQAATAEKYLKLTPFQKGAFVAIRQRENEKLADLYSRVCPENFREINSEFQRVQSSSAEEFRALLGPDQAKHLGQSLSSMKP